MLRVGFIVTNLTLPSRAVVRFYNKRGTAEQWISAISRRISAHRGNYCGRLTEEIRAGNCDSRHGCCNLWKHEVVSTRGWSGLQPRDL